MEIHCPCERYLPLVRALLLTCCYITLSSFGKDLAPLHQNKKPLYFRSRSVKPTGVVTNTDTISLDVLADSLAAPLLLKPHPLKPIPTASDDPLQALDQQVTKQSVYMAPYVPLVQEISIAIEGTSLLKNTWYFLKNFKGHEKNSSSEYAGSLGILFRKNIQFSADGGYVNLYPAYIKGNNNINKTEGFYGSIGFDYLSTYSATDNLYIGLRYSRSYFKNHTLPKQVDIQVIKDLKASWLELILGAETHLFDNLGLYGGCTLRIGWLYNFTPFIPARNYMIPGYGSNTNKFRSSLNLYILYKISFIERMIKFT